MRTEGMTRAEAAAMLGVPVDAAPETVRHAWRLWARVAHPDVGGDPGHFARLEQARRILQRPLPRPVEPQPRATWPEVLRRPARPWLLVVSAAVVVSLATLPALTGAPALTVPFVVMALPAGVAAAGWAALAADAALGPRADRGHRMLAIAVAWLPLAAAQHLVATVAGVTLLTVLPVLALPLAAAVSLVNPGAGLWRPAPPPT